MKKNIKLFFIFALFLTSSTGNAIQGLKNEYTQILSASLSSVLDKYPTHTTNTCEVSFSKIADNNEISILLAFGYMDVSGQDGFDSTSLYSNGSVLDKDSSSAMIQTLTSTCLGKKGKSGLIVSNACGFSKSGNRLSKYIKDRFNGKSTRVIIDILTSSYSDSDLANRSTYLNQQNSLSESSTVKFRNALSQYDIVLYLGHARSGGGPDFNPPLLLASGHVDYSYYKKNKPGLKNLISGLTSSTNPKMLGLFACKSTGLFSGTLKNNLPNNSMLITADDLFYSNDILPTAINLVEAVTRQSCGQDFDNIVKSYLATDSLSIF